MNQGTEGLPVDLIAQVEEVSRKVLELWVHTTRVPDQLGLPIYAEETAEPLNEAARLEAVLGAVLDEYINPLLSMLRRLAPDEVIFAADGGLIAGAELAPMTSDPRNEPVVLDNPAWIRLSFPNSRTASCFGLYAQAAGVASGVQLVAYADRSGRLLIAAVAANPSADMQDHPSAAVHRLLDALRRQWRVAVER